jgi:hypothetical protein
MKHRHIHAIVTEGGFTDSGHFVSIPDIAMPGCIDLWKEKVFAFLLAEEKITQEIVDSMRQWEHSGFGIDNSVRLAADDHEAM